MVQVKFKLCHFDSSSIKIEIYSNGKNLRLLKFVIKVGVANTH